MPYDPNTDVGKVRLLIADTGSTPTFSDAEVQAALDMESQSITLAAADLLDSLAALYARRSNRLQVLDITVDFSKVAADLRAQAESLRAAEADGTAFGIGEMVDGGFAREERRFKQFERTRQ